jgi:hypothetical protein
MEDILSELVSGPAFGRLWSYRTLACMVRAAGDDMRGLVMSERVAMELMAVCMGRRVPCQQSSMQHHQQPPGFEIKCSAIVS